MTKPKKQKSSTEVPTSLNLGNPTKFDLCDTILSNTPSAITSESSRSIMPRYFTVKRKDSRTFSNTSPFVIEKYFSNLLGAVPLIRKTADGLLIGVENDNQSVKLAAIKKFQDLDIDVTPHSTLNYSRGVVVCRDLLNCSTDEILDNLQSQNVIAVRNIQVTRDGQRRDSASFVLTFNTTSLPSKIKAGFHSLSVRPYIPPPVRCYRCQRFGHTSLRCSRNPTCECGRSVHVGSPCALEMVCVNCNGNHSARSRDCPMYIEESAIQRLKILERLSYSEARNKIRGSRPIPGKSYAQTVVSKEASANSIIVRDITAALIPEISRLISDKFDTLGQPSLTQHSFSRYAAKQKEQPNLIPYPVEKRHPSTLPQATKPVKPNSVASTSVTEYMELEQNIDAFLSKMQGMSSTDRSSLTTSIKSPRVRSRNNSTSLEDIPNKKSRNLHAQKEQKYSRGPSPAESHTDADDEEIFTTTPEVKQKIYPASYDTDIT